MQGRCPTRIRPFRRTTRKARGIVLVLALILVWTLLMVSGSMLTRSLVEQRASLTSMNGTVALALAEAGLDVAIQALRTNPNYAGTAYQEFGKNLGGYTVQVVPDGSSRWIIQATGFYPSNPTNLLGTTTTTVMATVQRVKIAGPGHGVLGDRSVRFDGLDDDEVRVDSYDSRQGTYSSQGSSGHVRVTTNEFRDRAITLLGKVVIMGDVVLGPGSDPEVTLRRLPNAWTSISGSVIVAKTTAPVEPVELPSLPERGRLQISGNEVVTLPGGLYRFRDIHISGKGQLVFTGPAEVYVEQRLQVGGSGVETAQQRPTNLSFYVKGSRVVLNSDTDLFAKITAPYATVEISGNGDVYGAVIGRDVVVRGGADIHYDQAVSLYDEALNPPSTGDPAQVSVLSWREVAP